MSLSKRTYVTGSKITAENLNAIQDAIILQEERSPTKKEITNALGYMPLKETDIPKELKNPNALKFTGAVSATYDGSTEVNATVPSSGLGLNVKDFGAKGDGSTDGTAVIQEAINAARWPRRQSVGQGIHAVITPPRMEVKENTITC